MYEQDKGDIMPLCVLWEAKEEVGIDVSKIEILGRLGPSTRNSPRKAKL